MMEKYFVTCGIGQWLASEVTEILSIVIGVRMNQGFLNFWGKWILHDVILFQ